MKTDRFTDIIRRKLESIRPEFTENDWTKMQAALQQAAPSSSTIVQHPASRSWFARPWVPLTAAASVAALVAVAAWQQTEIATLRQTVQSLSPAKPASSPLPSSHPAALPAAPTIIHQADTVYITKYVPVPANSSPILDQPENRGQWATASPSSEPERQEVSVTGAPERTTQRRVAPGAGVPSSPMPSATTGTDATNEQLAVNRPDQPENERTTNPSTRSAASSSGRTRSDLAQSGTSVTPYEESRAGTLVSKTQRTRTGESVAERVGQTTDTRNRSESVAGSRGAAGTPTNTYTEPNEPAKAGESAIAVTFDQLANQPLQLTDTDWNTMLLRKATRRMRPSRTVTVSGPQAPASQSVASFAPRFRLGVGSDFSERSISTAIAGELILGKHWTLGVGYGQSTCSDGDFLSEKDFNMNNPQPFRKEFDKVVDPRADPAQFIANIRLKRVQQQIPLQVGYRIPVSKSFTVLPTVGTNLTLSNDERLTFDRIAKVFGGTDIVRVESSRSRPYEVFNNLTFGTAVEWQKNHWVAQAGPLATTQLTQEPRWNAYSSFNVGARVRLFYQF